MLPTAFVGSVAASAPALRAVPPASIALGRVSGMQHPESAALGVKIGVASALCSGAAIRALRKSRRRHMVSTKAVENSRENDARTRGYYVPTLVINWQVDPKTPVPGSQKALENMVGADVEIGDGKPWDPLGFSKLYDRNFDFNMVMTYPHVQWLREAEIKHGRICMLAFVGIIAQKFFHIPGYPNAGDWTTALDVCYSDKTATLGIVQISLFTMLVEGKYYSGDAWIGQMDREPGDLGFDLDWASSNSDLSASTSRSCSDSSTVVTCDALRGSKNPRGGSCVQCRRGTKKNQANVQCIVAVAAKKFGCGL